MREFVALLALVSATVVFSPAAPAQAGTPGCITKTEFRAISKGMTIERARKRIGHHGRVSSVSHFSDGDAWKDVDFRQCGVRWTWSSVSISFEKTEKEVWVSDWYCDDLGCEDWGGWETKYTLPFRMTSKYAYWS